MGPRWMGKMKSAFKLCKRGIAASALWTALGTCIRGGGQVVGFSASQQQRRMGDAERAPPQRIVHGQEGGVEEGDGTGDESGSGGSLEDKPRYRIK